MLYWPEKTNYDRIDNDLKYRYIKMKGEATPEHIAELEEIFALNRENVKIRKVYYKFIINFLCSRIYVRLTKYIQRLFILCLLI